MSNKQLPCKNCLTLSVCKAIFVHPSKLDNEFVGTDYYVMMISIYLYGKCCLIEDYILKDDSCKKPKFPRDKLKETIEFFFGVPT